MQLLFRSKLMQIKEHTSFDTYVSLNNKTALCITYTDGSSLYNKPTHISTYILTRNN